MFWLLMYMWFSGGTPPPEQAIIPAVNSARESLADSPRLEDALSVVGEGTLLEEQLAAATEVRDTELVRLAWQHGAESEQFHTAFSSLDRTRLAAQQALLDHRFRLRELLTREEWDALYEKP